MQVRCPRCGSFAPVEAGRMPVCPSCGFAGGPPSEGPGIPPARPTEFIEEPLAGSGAPVAHLEAPPRKGVGGGWLFFMVVMGVLLVGAIALAVAYQQALIDWQP